MTEIPPKPRDLVMGTWNAQNSLCPNLDIVLGTPVDTQMQVLCTQEARVPELSKESVMN